jgi:hypothetical protein
VRREPLLQFQGHFLDLAGEGKWRMLEAKLKEQFPGEQRGGRIITTGLLTVRSGFLIRRELMRENMYVHFILLLPAGW